MNNIDEIVDMAKEKNCTHAILFYNIDYVDDKMVMMVRTVALYNSVPRLVDIVQLFADTCSQPDKFGLTDDLIENLFVRCDTIETLEALLGSAYFIKPMAKINLEDDGFPEIMGNA